MRDNCLKRILVIILTIILVMPSFVTIEANAAVTPSLSSEKMVIGIGSYGMENGYYHKTKTRYTLTVENSNKKASYSFTSKNKKIATVKKSGTKAYITGVKAGTTTITVKQKLKGKTTTIGKCKVVVKAAKATAGNKAIEGVSVGSNIVIGGYEQEPLCNIKYYNPKAKYTYHTDSANLKLNHVEIPLEDFAGEGYSVYAQEYTAKESGTYTVTVKETYKEKTNTIGKIQIKVNEKEIDYPVLSSRGTEIVIGDSEQTVIEKFGTPGRIDNSHYGDTAYIYNDDYTKLSIIYMQDGEVIGFYSDSMDFVCQGVGYGDTVEESYNSTKDYSLVYYVDEIGTGFVNGVKVLSKKALTKNLDEVIDVMELQVLDLTNSVRARNGISTLAWSDLAAECARNHSKDMAINDYFAHTNLEGKSPSDRMSEVGIEWTTAGENIAAGHGDSTDVVYGWYQSSGHRKNMLTEEYTYLGVGLAVGGSYRNYYTQNFYALR